MNKFIGLIVLAGLLSGCTVDPDETKKWYDNATNAYDEGLKRTSGVEDCRLSIVAMMNRPDLMIVRCPNSSTNTSYQSGKTTHQNTVIGVPNQ